MRKRSVLLFLLLSAFMLFGITSCAPEKVTYKVTFDAAGEEFSDAQGSYFSKTITIFRDSTIVKPETASKTDGVIYNKSNTKLVEAWICKESGKVWNFSTGVRSDITLVAKWKDKPTV